MISRQAIEIRCADAIRLSGDLWVPERGPKASVIINPATGVLARYYHRYASFLASCGFEVLTYDYRGIGHSRPKSLRGCDFRWSDWGTLDFDAALRLMRTRSPGRPLHVVGHSFGGFLPGLAENAGHISRILAVGASYAYWPDYAARERLRLFMSWHIVMPLVTAIFGYFPGRRLGWLEDLPRGVACEWSFSRSRYERRFPEDLRVRVLDRFHSVRSSILSVTNDDDPFATVPAIMRGLSYYPNAEKTVVKLSEAHRGIAPGGHFGLFHSAHQSEFWRKTVRWLESGSNPWPNEAAVYGPGEPLLRPSRIQLLWSGVLG